MLIGKPSAIIEFQKLLKIKLFKSVLVLHKNNISSSFNEQK